MTSFLRTTYFRHWLQLQSIWWQHFSGADCESELDGCDTRPCSVGQNCTDLSAKEQGLSPLGYKCGPCPTGFTDHEGKCAG